MREANVVLGHPILYFCCHTWPIQTIPCSSDTTFNANVGCMCCFDEFSPQRPWHHELVTFEDQFILDGEFVSYQSRDVGEGALRFVSVASLVELLLEVAGKLRPRQMHVGSAAIGCHLQVRFHNGSPSPTPLRNGTFSPRASTLDSKCLQ